MGRRLETLSATTYDTSRLKLSTSHMPSSVIHSFEYDPRRRELLIVFQSGRRYVYQGVPPETFEGLKASASQGDFFNTHIREQFAFVRAANSKS
jgi:KTSC domain